jgi:hypothetical protein
MKNTTVASTRSMQFIRGGTLFKPCVKYSQHQLQVVIKVKEYQEAIKHCVDWLKTHYQLDANTANLLGCRIIHRNRYQAKAYLARLKQTPSLLQKEVMLELEVEINLLDKLIKNLQPEVLEPFVKRYGQLLQTGKQRLAALSDLLLELHLISEMDLKETDQIKQHQLTIDHSP